MTLSAGGESLWLRRRSMSWRRDESEEHELEADELEDDEL